METQTKAFPMIAIAITQNLNHLQTTSDLLTKNSFAGQFMIGSFLLSLCE
jgi:hypothetical protein